MNKIVHILCSVLLLAVPALAQWNPSPGTPAYDDVQNLQPAFSAWRVADDQYYQAGDDGDFAITHDGTDTWLESILDGARIVLQGEDTGATMRTLIEADPDAEVGFYSAGTKVFETESDGLDMLTNPISNVADPTDDQDAATKIWTETELAGAGGQLPTDWVFGSITNSTLGYTNSSWVTQFTLTVDTEYLFLVMLDVNTEFTVAQSDIAILETGGGLGTSDGRTSPYTGDDGTSTTETSLYLDLNAAIVIDHFEFFRFIAADFDGSYTGGSFPIELNNTTNACGIRITGGGVVGYRDQDSDDDCAFIYWTR